MGRSHDGRHPEIRKHARLWECARQRERAGQGDTACQGTRARIPQPLLPGLLVAVLLAAGCASSGSRIPVNEDPVPEAALLEYTNLYLALQELRPSWIRQARELFVDEGYRGSIAALTSWAPDQGTIRYIELVPVRDMVRRFGPCQEPAGTGGVMGPERDPSCGTRPVIHVVRY